MNSINTKLKTLLLILSILTLSAASLYAQTVRGVVNDADTNEPLPGVNILLQGTTIGTSTNVDGEFELTLPSLDGVLVVTFIGYNTTQVPINNRSFIEISLIQSTIVSDEIIVTALGLRREARSLGYSTQEIKGESIERAREANFVNQLSGRIAGVNVTGGFSTSMGSSRIVIRGESSLSGSNQPLFVVDGVPINNDVQSSPNTRQDIDYGNGAMDLNPNDIESVNVLKGPSAAALYGSRASNGVVLITTKSGAGQQGIGVSINSGVAFESYLRIPDFQNEYGQGVGGSYKIGDGGRSWGPPLDGRSMNIPVNSEFPFNQGETVEWVPYPNNVSEFYQVGRSISNNVAISGNTDQSNFRLSFTNLDQTGIVPNTDLRRNNVSLNASFNASDRLRASGSANYINNSSDQRPVISYGNESVAYTWLWEGRQVRTDKMKDYWIVGLEGVRPFTYNFNFNDNPYYSMNENLSGLESDRLIGNLRLDYEFSDKISLFLRSGADISSELRESRRTIGSRAFVNGMYKQDRIQFRENNTDILFTFQDQFSQDWTFNSSLGGNIMQQNRSIVSASTTGLSVPGVYNLGNTLFQPVNSNFIIRKQINSIYATANFGFRNYLFFDVSARNDWSSTLPTENNSYLYPSISSSAVISDILNISTDSYLSFAKVRAAISQVGGDTSPYSLQNVYSYQSPWGNTQSLSVPSTIRNPDLKPEISTNYEFGADIRFFQDRIGLDVTYYDEYSRNQIINIPVSEVSGFSSVFINAGLIRNRGVEIMLNTIPVIIPNRLRWQMNFNWARNVGTVLELGEGIETYQMSSRYVSVQAREGGRMGDMYGLIFVRDSNGNIVHNQGLALTTTELHKVGNYNPDWSAGISNSITYKNLTLDILFDIRYGGQIYSRTFVIGNESGQLVESLPGRDGGWVGQGVMLNEQGDYVPNNVNVTAQRYWGGQSYFRRDNAENSIFDATYAKLRELRIGYTLPRSVLGNLSISDATISLVGRNLFLWSKVPHIDPETGSMAGSNFLPGIDSVNLPTTRTIGFNLNLRL